MAERARAAPLALMAASGFAGLGYQIVWTQQAGTWLGHEAVAVLAVVAAFFGGLALGAATLARRIDRSPHPARWYAGCEAVIALWAVVLVFAMAPAGQALAGWVGDEPSTGWHLVLAFGGTFVLLLPATAAMGATLPAMERVAAAWGTRAGSLAALYAANTAGAVAGVGVVAFVLVPQIGLARAALVCALLNAACAVGAWWLQREPLALPAKPPTHLPPARRLALMLAATGFLGIAYEVLALRVLSQVCENTVYTYASLLAVYLVGTAFGAAAHARWAAGGVALTERLLAALALAVLLGAASLWGAEWHRSALAQALDGGALAAVLAEASLAAAAFVLPTLVMGALFSQLCTEARQAGLAFGPALALNTGGAAAAPAVFGALLLPTIGAKAALLVVALGYLGLLPRQAWRRPAPALATVAAALLLLAAPPLRFVQVPEGGQVLSHREGLSAAVSVVEDAQGVAVLRINNRQQEGSSASAYADGRQALLPLLLHPAPRRALFLGLGTGVTAGTAATWDPTLEIDAVELLPEVIAASAHFRDAAAQPGRLQVHAADARRYVRRAGPAYDVVVADNFHPARSGSAALYTVEHFAAVRERLASDGLFCQWLPLHQLDLPTLQSIVRSYQAVFPHGQALLATLSLQTPTLGLIARRDGAPFAPAAPPARAAAYGLADRLAVLGSFVASPDALRRWSAGAPLNTDDRPIVSVLAPRITYAPDSTPAERLLMLTRELSVTPATLAALDAEESTRLAAYLRARDGYLAAGRQVQPSGDVRRMLAQVQQPLLALLRISPEFAPAREPLLRMADALQPLDPEAAAALRAELAALAR